MSKILVLIDGFNFYHRLKVFQGKYNVCVKWLDYKKLILHYFQSQNDSLNEYEFIYFSAIAEHRGISCAERHKIYIEALKSAGINIVLGKFKEKKISRCSCSEKCVNCTIRPDKTKLIKHEEKNTDVNIAITLVEKALQKSYDSCYILSSDSDFYSAIERAKQLHPKGKLILVPPPLPENSKRNRPYCIKEIKQLTGNHPLFISWNVVKKAQFPDKISQNIYNPWKIT